jgi:hypothetical protein
MKLLLDLLKHLTTEIGFITSIREAEFVQVQDHSAGVLKAFLFSVVDEWCEFVLLWCS